MKKEPEYQWNYRVCTWIDYEYADETGGERLFGVRMVHYAGKVPRSASDGEFALNDIGSLPDLVECHRQMGLAFDKPILDLDNNLQEFDPTQEEEL